MKKKSVRLILFILSIGWSFRPLVFGESGPAETKSLSSALPGADGRIAGLSHIFLPGKGIEDTDGDSLPDRISFRVVLPDRPSAQEMAVAADIAARANLECLTLDFDVVTKESEFSGMKGVRNIILVGSSLRLMKDIIKEGSVSVPSLSPDQGLVFFFSHKGYRGLALIAGSPDSLLKTGRAFFLRWPYLWDIWGREEGATYFSLENDLLRFLEQEGLRPNTLTVRTALYEFPAIKSSHDTVKRLNFSPGEIKELAVEIAFSDRPDREKAFRALNSLRTSHRRGELTDILSYPGCGRLTFVLGPDNPPLRVFLPRLGHPRRFLTPGYRDPKRANLTEKEFDLRDLFTAKGLYTDGDRDNIVDGVATSVVLPKDAAVFGIAPFASRLVLPTAGASFPLVYLENEVENPKSLLAPVLIGDNALNQELAKTGKLRIPSLEKGWGMAGIIPKAFNRSNALSIVAADEKGLEKTLNFMSRTFPYFEDYGEGNPQLADVSQDLEKFLRGENGSAEALFEKSLKKIVGEIKEKDFESFSAEFYLPRENPAYIERARKFLGESLKAPDIEVKTFTLRESKKIFEKEKEFTWEADDAFALIEEKAGRLDPAGPPAVIHLALSESPHIRSGLKSRVEELLIKRGVEKAEVEVLSAYKQGFFWLTENVLPGLKRVKPDRLTIAFAEEKEDFSRPKRFYAEPARWLQELYPVDEILASELGLPLDKIHFEMREETKPVYTVTAYDEKNTPVYKEEFSPRIKEIPYLKVLPEWGTVKITPGWLQIKQGKETVLDTDLQCDLEKFWVYYQDEVLAPVYSHIMKKTGNEPTTSKQPYFKRLLVEMRFSEPDYRLGLDEELISSLEAMHDEIYFDTLDFLRGITDVELEEKEQPEDTSRLSAPGNVFPLVYPSIEGGAGKVKIVFEDWQAPIPQLLLKWKEKGRPEEFSKKVVFPSLKPRSLRVPALIYNGNEELVENLAVEFELGTEAEYLSLLDILESYRSLAEKGVIPSPFNYPRLKSITLRVKFKDLEKEETLGVSFKSNEMKKPLAAPVATVAPLVPDEIISPEMCLAITERLGRYPGIRSYIGGRSYEDRKIPVLEVFAPSGKYVSLPRLLTFKPTLFLIGRQHANEVSATSYILKLAELLARDETYREYLKKMNFVLLPLENADGAALAYELQKITPFHSLHAGRYGALGVEIGSQTEAAKIFFPEAAVRRNLYDKWLPDIQLNLHGYPSHEWVQQFSNYSPYLFRDYWIPRGWFAYYRALTLPIYDKWKQAGEELKQFIIDEMQADGRIRESNRKFYERYRRWATRWQPHLNDLELHGGLGLYAKRRSSVEARLTPRSQMTYVEQTPELMDETAQGAWLAFLCEQGLTYVRAHLKYLAQARFDICRVEEEVQDRVRIQFVRSRPGKIIPEAEK